MAKRDTRKAHPIVRQLGEDERAAEIGRSSLECRHLRGECGGGDENERAEFSRLVPLGHGVEGRRERGY